MDFTPHTEAERQEMLGAIGAASYMNPMVQGAWSSVVIRRRNGAETEPTD
jgi:hypothetical protein